MGLDVWTSSGPSFYDKCLCLLTSHTFMPMQDRDESQESLEKGLPVVSFSIGDTAEFLYGDEEDVTKAQKVNLESGDVLIFGGKSRHIFHGVRAIITQTTPKALQEETNIHPGRLNLTFRQY